MRRPEQAAREWFEQAQHDFDTDSVNYDITAGRISFVSIANKPWKSSLKGVLVFHGQDITRFRIHDLPQLLHTCERYERRLKSLKPVCKQLTGFYIAARHPVGARYTPTDAHRAVTSARNAVGLIRRLFRKSAQ